MKAKARVSGMFGGSLVAGTGVSSGGRPRGRFLVECYGADGRLKWREDFHNLITEEAEDDLLSVHLAGGTQTTTWFVGLKNTGAPAAGDTMASHVSWTENVTYSDATRRTWTPGAVAAGSVDNSAARATFNMNGTTTIFGAFLTSNNTKSGTTGKLYAVGNFASSRAVENGDQLLVTYTALMADDGV